MTGYEQVGYDAGMHPQPASTQTSPQVRNCRPRSGIPAIVARGHSTERCAVPGELPARAGTHGGGSVTTAPDPAQELAELRRAWGDGYRITWDGARYRATHIISADAMDAANAADLRKLLSDHHSRQAARSSLWPPAVDDTTTFTSATAQGNRRA